MRTLCGKSFTPLALSKIAGKAELSGFIYCFPFSLLLLPLLLLLLLVLLLFALCGRDSLSYNTGLGTALSGALYGDGFLSFLPLCLCL